MISNPPKNKIKATVSKQKVPNRTLPSWIGEREVASMIGVSVGTLRNDRSNGVGIPYSKFGSSVRYRLDDVIQTMESQHVNTTVRG